MPLNSAEQCMDPCNRRAFEKKKKQHTTWLDKATTRNVMTHILHHKTTETQTQQHNPKFESHSNNKLFDSWLYLWLCFFLISYGFCVQHPLSSAPIKIEFFINKILLPFESFKKHEIFLLIKYSSFFFSPYIISLPFFL